MPENPEKRKRGIKYPLGYIKRKILELVYNSPKGISRGEIQDFLRTKYNIRESSGKTERLKDLEREHYIRSEYEPGKAKIFYSPENTDSVPTLLQDPVIWGPIPNFKSDDKSYEIFVKWQNQRRESRQELYHTKFFEQTVRDEITRRLLFSPPHLDVLKENFHLDLKTEVKSEVDKEALKNLYSRAASISQYLIMHMFVPMFAVDGALHVSLYNSLVLDRTFSEEGQNLMLVDEQIAKIREIFEKVRGKQDYIWEYRFTNLESFSLATVFICLTYELQSEPQNSDIVTFFQDDKIKEIFLRYIPKPFFYAEVMKFIFCQPLYFDVIEAQFKSL